MILETECSHALEWAGALAREGYEPVRAADVLTLIQAVRLTPPDVVLVGSKGGDAGASLTVVRAIRAADGRVPVVLLVDQGSEALAVAALRAGASDYVKRSEGPAALRECLARFLRPASSAEPDLVAGYRLLGDSEVMAKVRQQIRRVAVADSNLLVTGETGTGKELVAELVHSNSARRARPFVSVNCAAIPDGLLESELFGHEKGAFTGADRRHAGKLQAAAGGTLFLDEIGDMSEHTQAKVLRAIEHKEVQRLGCHRSEPVDVRIVAATNHDVERLVEEGSFRQDLYYRLDVARIELPPLRERREDLHLLCRCFLDELNRRFDAQVEGFTPRAFNYLFLHSWPGNVRELRNVLEAAFVNGAARYIDVDDLPSAFLRRFGDAKSRPLEERDRILWTLHTCRWNKSKAAKELRWSRMTLYRKLDRYHIVPRVDDEL